MSAAIGGRSNYHCRLHRIDRGGLAFPLRTPVSAHGAVHLEGPGPQRSGRCVGADDDTRGGSFRAGEREFARWSPVGKKTFPFAQQDWIDEQQNLIRKPLLEQHRCQRRTAPEDQVRPALRLDVANALDDVLSEAFDRTPSRLSGLWVTTYFVAAFRLSASALLGAFGQKPAQMS